MTDVRHVAVLRNTRCGHVVAIATIEREGLLWRRLIQMRGMGWTVQVVPNTPAIYDAHAATCATCRP